MEIFSRFIFSIKKRHSCKYWGNFVNFITECFKENNLSAKMALPTNFEGRKLCAKTNVSLISLTI